MQAGYFQTAWNDIKHTDGWAKKIALLALLQFIPIFGQIVLFGYLYGWARDIAWNVHQPMPERIFGDTDGNLYLRGFFVLVITFVFGLIPNLISTITSAPMEMASDLSSGILTLALSGTLISVVLALVAQAFAWVGSMRSAIYNRIGPGFQIPQIWKMIRYDTNGILRIVGMVLLIGLILGVIFAFILSLIFGGALVSLYATGAFDSNSPNFAALFSSMGLGMLVFFAALYALMFGSTWLQALECRAMGYWTRQFNVAAWGGEHEPLPFEAGQAAQAAQAAQYAAQVEYTQAQAQAAQVQGQKIEYQNQQAQQGYAQAQAEAQAQAQPQVQVAPVQPAASAATVAPTAPVVSEQPAAHAGTSYTQPYAQPYTQQAPDWITEAKASAPAEQQSPYAAAAQEAQSVANVAEETPLVEMTQSVSDMEETSVAAEETSEAAAEESTPLVELTSDAPAEPVEIDTEPKKPGLE